MRKLAIGVLKIALSLGIMTYLVWNAIHAPKHANVFAELANRTLDKGLLAAAFGVFLVGSLLLHIRWWYLARAIGIPCPLSVVIEAGFWGLLFNQAPLGVVSGDVVKAVLLARRAPGRKGGAIASVLVDRAIGMYVLFVLLSVVFLTSEIGPDSGTVGAIATSVYLVTAAGAVAIALVLASGEWADRSLELLTRVPAVGPALAAVLAAIRQYRFQQWALVWTSGVTVLIHTLSTVGCYLLARALGGEVLGLPRQFVAVLMGIAACILPLPLGPFEFVMEFMYVTLSQGAVSPGQGLLVALLFRIVNLAVIGLALACSAIWRVRGRNGLP